jgi:DNA-binding SARP family transcriptional activator
VVRIRLLGPPAIERDGVPVPPPRGRRAWGLLAYLLLADRPPGRRHLAELLFSEADDSLGALRWTLAELRRALAAPELLGGDPVATTLGDGVTVDLDALTGELADPRSLLDLDGELLEGLSVAASPTFESWLVVERHHLAATAEARLRQVALALLAGGQARAAVAYASRAVARNPLEEGNHELLVRSLAASGDRAAALRQVAVGERNAIRAATMCRAPCQLTEVGTPGGVPGGKPS